MIAVKKNIIFELLGFCLPIALGQVGLMLIGAGDVFVAGRYSQEVLGAVGVGHAISSLLMISGMGMVFGMGPFMAQKRGSGVGAEGYLGQVILYSLGCSLISMLVMRLGLIVLPYFPIESALLPLVIDYIEIVLWSFPGFVLYGGLKEYLQSMDRIWVANIISLGAVISNIALNFVLVKGLGPIPEMGIKGLALASLIIRSLMAILLAVYAFKVTNFKEVRKSATAGPLYGELIKFSLPIALTVFLEMAAFSLATVVIGTMTVAQAAAHNIVITVASITFMLPLSLSSALSVKVGHSLGQNDFQKLRVLIGSGLFMALSFMGITAILFFFFPHFWVSLFNTDPEVISWGVKLIIIAAIFQLSDGAQITLAGILRGLQKTRAPFSIYMTGFWAMGLPIGLYLAYEVKLYSEGIWMGLAIGLTIVSIGLAGYLGKVLKAMDS